MARNSMLGYHWEEDDKLKNTQVMALGSPTSHNPLHESIHNFEYMAFAQACRLWFLDSMQCYQASMQGY